MSKIAERAKLLKEEVESLGGNLIAVSKTFTSEDIKKAHEGGVNSFGENYLKEVLPKIESLKDLNISWHFLGRIQTGTLSSVINKFDLIHTGAKLSHLEKINLKTQKPQRVLLQIKHPSDERDYGILEGDLGVIVEKAQTLQKIKLCGLMFLPPGNIEGQGLDEAFMWAKGHFDRISQVLGDEKRQDWKILSMGMSGDYKKALKKGSTHVRIGRAIFGER